MDGKIGQYREVDTLGKSQLDLILQVYDGAMTAYRAAREHYKKNEPGAGQEKLEKAKKFIVHLYTTLNPEKGGQIAANLGELYTFVITRSDMAAATRDSAHFDQILQVLGNLRAGWAALSEREKNAGKNPRPEAAPDPERQFSTTG